MIISSILLFSFSLIISNIIINIFGERYALASIDERKQHVVPISQIGGLIFSVLFLLISYNYSLIPNWFLIGGSISIILGALDDNFDIKWYYKLLVQLFLVGYLAHSFWGQFTQISLYKYLFSINQIELLIIFSIWFIGIYNAVNLIDGLDGLASGFMIIYTIAIFMIGDTDLSNLSHILIILLIVFLLLNQRPAKVFMGDTGSLFLGFFVAVLPLLNSELSFTRSYVLNMTPFLILSSFLIADTTRVFFTRIFSGNSPMTADTIHFHHLVLKNSGSYLLTLFLIFFVVTISAIFSILTSSFNYGSVGILAHFSLMFLFILTPPAPTYVKIIWKTIKPVYHWQKLNNNFKQSGGRTLLVIIMLFILLGSMFFSIKMSNIWNLKFLLSCFLIALFIYLNRSNKIVIPTLQIFSALVIMELGVVINFGFLSQLLTILLLICWIVFTLQRVTGTIIFDYSALDILIIFISTGGILLYFLGIPLNFWIFMTILAIWFNTGFVLRRTIYLNSSY